MQLATLNPTYAITVGKKSYPKPEENVLTTQLEGMAKTITGKLSLKSAKDMYPAFGKHVGTFNKTFDELKTFVVAIVGSNMSGNDKEAIAAKLSPLRTHLNKVQFAPPPGLTAEVAIKPPDQQLAMLNQSIALSVGALTYFLAKSLDDLVAAQQVGLIEWFSDKVTRFHFYLNSFDTKQSILNRRHTKNGRDHTETTDRATTKTERRQRHQHDLVNAKALPISTYVPYRVERLVNEIPPLFKDFFHVVQGDQIFEHVIEDVQTTVSNQSETRSWTDPVPQPARSVYQYDPALVIGEYVVAGWDEDEEKRSKAADEQMKKQFITHGVNNSEVRALARTIMHLKGEGDALTFLSNVRGNHPNQARTLAQKHLSGHDIVNVRINP